MKKNERKMILILIIVVVIIIAVLVKVRSGKDSQNIQGGDGQTIQSGDNTNSNTTGNATSSKPTEENVELLEDGTKLNVSSKLSETKTAGNYEISNIQLTEKDGQSLILADVKNVGSSKTELKFAKLTLLDKDGKEITTIQAIIGEAEPGATVQLNASATMDFANAYDFTITIVE